MKLVALRIIKIQEYLLLFFPLWVLLPLYQFHLLFIWKSSLQQPFLVAEWQMKKICLDIVANMFTVTSISEL